jgi:CHAD domain-containing protein
MGQMEIATETERKYDVPADFELPRLSGLGVPETHELDATYFDTSDLRLTRHKRTLRRRTGGTDAGWHLKTPGDGTSRTEHRLPLAGDEVPAELMAEVRSIVRDHPLEPVVRLRTTRIETPITGDAGQVLALVAQDAVTAETDGHEQRWQEIEVELVDGDAKVLKTVEKALLRAGATPSGSASKLARALGDRALTPKTLTPKTLTPKTASNQDPVLAYARQQRDDLQAYDPGVRHGDPEAVHKMRVATRRLRSTLKTFKRSFDGDTAPRVADDLKWLAHLLGEVRDGQVLTGKLLGPVEQDGPEFAPVAERLKAHLTAKVDDGRAALGRELDGERYLRLLDAIDVLVDTANGERDPQRRAGKALAKADRLLDEAMTDGVDAELHEARKAYKGARYAVEVFAPEGGKPGKELIKRLTDLQDVLGAHQDSVVAREIIRELAGSAQAEGESAFAYGIQYARQEQVGAETRDELPTVLLAARQYKLRSWLD